MVHLVNIPISVVILTFNEEDNIANCLASLSWCNDIVVLDSFSEDSTEAIVSERKARFYQREFDDYARQRNYGITEIAYKHPWLLMVDADEVVPEDLVVEMGDVISTSKDICIYRMRRKDHFMGKWIKHSSGYPTWFGRLLRIGRVRVERAINEEYVTDGEVGLLKTHLVHYPFNKGFHSWFEKHNRYSSMEAESMVLFKSGSNLKMKDMFDSDPSIRRKFIKTLIYKLPGRPLIMFFLLYLFKGGFLDGAAGFRFCVLRSFYEYMIDCKVTELKCRAKKVPI